MNQAREIVRGVREHFSKMKVSSLISRLTVFEQSRLNVLDIQLPETDESRIVGILKKHSIDVLYTTSMVSDPAFCFKTNEEAEKAHKIVVYDNDLNIGWYYGEQEFWGAIKKHVDEFGFVAPVIKVKAIS